MAGQDDGWETVTSISDVPPEVRKNIGVTGVRKAFGIGENDTPLPDGAAKRLEDQVSIYGALKGARGGFRDEFAGNTLTGGLENSIQSKFGGFGTAGQRDWWAAFQQNDNQIRNELFGSALTSQEKAAFDATSINPSMDPAEIKRNLERREELVRGALSRRTAYFKANGYKPGAVDALLGEYGPDLSERRVNIDSALSDAEREGGDPASGLPGATAADGAPPSGPDDRGELTFNDQLPEQRSDAKEYTPEQRAQLVQIARTGTVADMRAAAASWGLTFPQSDAELQGVLDKIKANPQAAVGVADVNNSVKPVDAGDGALGAAARGAGNVLTFGGLDEVGALADVVTQGGTYDENLDRRRGQELYDEQQNGGARLLGQIVGGLPIGVLEFMGAREAASVAGRAAMRTGMTGDAARALANRVFAARTAAESATIGGAYGFGNTEGGLAERTGGAALNAAVGGAAGGALALGGGRFARAMAARRSAAVAARPASVDDALRTGNPTTEAGRIAQLAEQQGIAILPQDIADGPMIGRMTAGQAQTPFGTNTIRRATDNLYGSFSRRVGEVGGEAGTAAEVGGAIKQRSADLASREAGRAEASSATVLRESGDATDLTGAGIVAQRGATRWMEQTADRANALYARVPIQPEADASLGSTRAALAELNEGMRSNPELGAIFSSPRLQALERAVTDDVDPQTGEILRESRLSWRDLQEFRTRIGDALDDPRLSEKIASRQLRRLYGALSDDMRATAEAQGPDALRAWRRANDYYDGRMKRVNNTLSAVLGERRDRTPSEAMAALNGMLREGSTGDAARFSRTMRSMAPEDARVVRATIVQEARGGRRFDAKELADNWERLSERGKSALLPQAGLRDIMDDAAGRAAASQRDPLAAKSGQQVVAALEDMAKNRGDSVAFRRQLAALSPDEANSVRALLVHRMGQTKTDAVNAGDGGEVFSISHFLKTWEGMTPEAKVTLFGSGEMRSDMDALATLAKRVQGSEALRGHSNTGAVNSLNATTGGLGAAAIALLAGHPIVAAGLAAPAVYQRLSAEALTSPRLLKWLARAQKKPNIQAQRQHIAALSSVARSEPGIASDVLSLQQRLADAFGGAPARLAADERRDRRDIVDRQDNQGASANQRLQP